MSITSLETHTAETSGVRVLWADLPIDPTMTVWFGVGHQDMSPATAGITHLVEHLVMRRLGHVAIPHNAESGMVSTQFYATGTPTRLVDFVERVCEAVTWVRTVTDEDLVLERRTILAEVGLASLYAGADAFSLRYGLRGMGLGAVSHTRLLDWTAAEVRAVAQEWFHAGNAMVVSTTPPPVALTLTLPAGPAPVRARHPETLLPGPSWTRAPGEHVVLSGTMSDSAPEGFRSLAISVLHDVLRGELRTTLGHVYSVEVMAFSLDPEHDLWTVVLDPPPESVCDVVAAACGVLERLATTGPTGEELERTRAGLLEEIELGAGRAGWFDSYASRSVRGITAPSLAEELELLASATPADLRGPVGDLRDSLLVMFPADHDPHETALTSLGNAGAREIDIFAPSTPPTDGRGRSFRGRFFSRARGLVFTLHDDRIVLSSPVDTLTVPLADVVLVGTDRDGDVELVTGRGAHLVVAPSLFRGFRKPFEAILGRIPSTATRYDKQRVMVSADEPVTTAITS
ncbi:pitrilysin family protein [Cellulomonas sp. Leaf334]|uniref:M16 family metallopeptidase n=1 Tax=Cellulomonas sp. Leaf334 TaxID=1736339 RepID=UPI0006FC7989|nr:insulinase family protein [Cellulomonas sp. Leaf334]KQR11056.1 hypothetical protein ASF78_15415 [Cellulomonas sp. Leaf334]